ncbi:MAG TPA: DUF5801 repeats-in-toxin domain-containing protein, partial [Terriglobales bacterium]|nr:DUF5801 repeats-in-toxin domain-containing protein [Terriglobales bacterium]
MATDNTNIPQTGNNDGTQHDAGLEVIQLAENTPPSGQGNQGNGGQPAANQPVIAGVPNGEVQVTIPAGQTVVRVQVAPGETIDLPFDGQLAAKFGQQGNLAIKHGDVTIILLGYAEANQQAGVTVKDDKGQAIDVASTIAQTDPNLDIQTAAGPAAGPAGPQGGHLFFGFGGGNGLGGFGELNVINPTELQYKLIQPDETIIVRAPETPPSFSVTGDLVVNEDDLHNGGDVSSEALILTSSSGPSNALIDQLSHSPTFSGTYFTFYSGSQGNDPFDVNDHENGSQNTPPLPDNFVDQNGHHIDQDPEPLSVTAHVTANLNGNTPGTLTFDHNGVTPVIQQLNTLGLTSQGHPLSYELLPPDGAHGESVVAYYTQTYTYGEQTYSYNVIVFSLEVDQVSSSTGQFDVTYTLYGPLDNAPHGAADTGAQGSGAAGEDIFFLDTTFFVNDSAGHSTESTPGQMVFQTVDDVPAFGHMEYGPSGQLEGAWVPVQYDPANLTIGVDESAGQQSTHYTINNPDTSTGQVADQNTDDATTLFTHVGSSYNYESTSLQAVNDVVHDSFASDPLGVLNNIDPSYFNNPGDHSQGFNTYIDSAQTWLDVSFGADGEAGTFTNTGEYVGNKEAGQTVFTGDGGAYATGFQLYMTSNHATLDNGGSLTTQVETNLTIGDGLKVYAYQIDADTIIGIAYPPQVEGDAVTNLAAVQANGIPVFSLHVDPETGALTLTEYHQINNPLGGDASNDTYANDAIQLLDSLGDQFVFVRATDFDGDYVDGGLAVSFVDDAPSAAIVTNTESGVTIDESAGQQADDQAGAAPFAYGTALAWGTSSGPVVNVSGSSYGTDGPGTTVLSLHPSSAGVDSGLIDTATGQHIYLYQDGDNVVGLVGSGGVADPHGAVAIAVSIDQAGDLTTAEYRALYHDIPTQGDTSEGVSIADGALQATVTVTDSDGDVATSTTDVGSHVSFLDDGPVAAITGTDTDGVSIDESAGQQADDHAGPAPFAYGTALAWGVTSAPVVDTSGTNFGADGEKSLVLALHPSSDGVDSGLIDTATGQHIYLYQDGDNVVGLVGSGGVADPNGAVAIAVSIDQSGDLTVAEYRALYHDIPTNGDTSEGVSIDPDALQVTVTATDGDGDTSQATTSVGGYVSFLDDGPTAHITAVAESGVTIDESAGVQAGTDDHSGPAPFAYGAALAWGTNGTAVVDTSATSFGADGEKSLVLGVQPSSAGVDSGLIDTATGQHIYLYQDGANVVGKVGSGGVADPSGAIAIAVTIDQSGDLTVAEYRALVQPTGTLGDTSEGVHINNSALQVLVTATDGDGDTSTATANIGSHVTFLDDGPTAVADTNKVSSGGSVGGNVETNDSFGVDGKDSGGGVVGVAIGSDTSSAVSGNLGGLGIPGSFGTLILNADGSYTYNANPNVGGIDHFVYTIKDGDGDLSTVTLDITVNKVGPETDTESVTVNEAALDTTTTGNDLTHGTITGSNPSSPDETKQGQLVLGAGVTVVGGNDQTGSFGTLHVGSDGKFTYTLTSNDLTNPPANNGTNTINNAETFTVTIKDADGNTNTDTITVNIIDDVPVVAASGTTVKISVDETPGNQ